jgi:uncharacterized Fe-S cluster-containing radical SAM superfamily protein
MDLNGWIGRCSSLRETLVKKEGEINKYLLANFSGTSQQKDIEKRTSLIGDYCRVKINVKAFDEKEMQKIGKSAVNFANYQEVSNALRNEFDMPQWAHMKLMNRPLKEFTNAFIWQLKGCNIHCPWCYVDDVNKNGEKGNGEFFSIPEVVDLFQEERKKQILYTIRPSGGEPTLAVEQWLEILEEIKMRGLEKKVYVQGDTNLTTGHFLDFMEETGMIEKNFLEKISKFENFGVLCSFKGTDTESFLKAIGMTKRDGFPNMAFKFLEEERWYTFSKFVKAGLDVYPFIYDANPETIKQFMREGAERFGNGFYLKTRIFGLKLYGPEKDRFARIGRNAEGEQRRLDDNFKKSYEIMNTLIQDELGIPYGEIPRTGINLKVKD